ncbi:hypothetical protein [Cupriavidus sp. 8B]
MSLDHCYQDDCRAVMRELIATGVRAQCIVSSSPYSGLRAYSMHDLLVVNTLNLLDLLGLCLCLRYQHTGLLAEKIAPLNHG